MRALGIIVAALLCCPARADLLTAQLAYEKGDYERAFKEYRELAELGQPRAQHNIAVMYAKGQGVQQSDLNAYAWATLAVESGDAGAQSLADTLRPLLAPGSEKIAADIAAPFRRAALDARLMPKIEEDDSNKCKLVRYAMPSYPSEADRNGIQGMVAVFFSVMPDGTVRNPRVLYAVPSGVFEAASRWAALRTRYPVRDAAGPSRHCVVLYRYLAQNQSVSRYPELSELVRTTRKKAETGDVDSQFIYGMLLAGLPQLGKNLNDALPWFVKAAQAGQMHAQFQVGSSLLLGMGCRCEESKGEVWLRRAAQADEADAQVTLAQYALRGSPNAADVRKAKLWLERAAAGNNSEGKLYLSALLATASQAELRDPPRALSLLAKVRRELGDDPIEFEIRAAAEADSGNFKDAVRSEQRAISEASRLHWDLDPLKERLASYQSGQPWFGSLLTF